MADAGAESSVTVNGSGGSGDSEAQASAIGELIDGAERWRLEPNGTVRGIDWLRLWDAWLVVAVAFVEAVLAFRFGFRLAAASAENGFVSLTYDLSRLLVSPFAGIVADGKLGASGVFEPSVLVAMLAYFVGAVLLMSIAWAVRSTRLAFPADPGNPPEFRRQVP